MLQHQITTLENNLRVITIPMPAAQSATVMVGVGAGSRFETNKNSGIFHFLEHMAFKGTTKRPTTLKISSEIEGVGGIINAFTGKEYTGYWIKLSNKHLRLAFDILSDVLSNSLLKQEEIDREKGVIIEEINMYEDNHQYKAAEEMESLTFGDNAMGWSIAGTKKIVSEMRRVDFMSILNQYYFNQNLIIAVAGGVTPSQVEKLAQNYFTGYTRQGKTHSSKIKLTQTAPQIKINKRKIEQGNFALGVPGLSLLHPDRYVGDVLSAILGGGMSSRLFLSIRERHGLAYHISSDSSNYTDTGLLTVVGGIKLQGLEKALELTMKELVRLKKELVSHKELTRAKEMIKGHMSLALEDSHTVAAWYAFGLLLENKIRNATETMAKIDAVTAEDIQRVANDLLKTEKLNLSIVGPYPSATPFKKLLLL